MRITMRAKGKWDVILFTVANPRSIANFIVDDGAGEHRFSRIIIGWATVMLYRRTEGSVDTFVRNEIRPVCQMGPEHSPKIRPVFDDDGFVSMIVDGIRGEFEFVSDEDDEDEEDEE
jgi:hypothetical protein